MHRTRLAPSLIWFIALSALPFTFACLQSCSSGRGDLVLEIADGSRGGQPSRYYASSTRTLWMELFEFKRLSNWRSSPDPTEDVGVIHLDYRQEGDAVRIDVRVMFGLNLDNGQLMGKGRTESGGTYVIHRSESGSLQELAQFGIEPIKVKVMSATSPGSR